MHNQKQHIQPKKKKLQRQHTRKKNKKTKKENKEASETTMAEPLQPQPQLLQPQPQVLPQHLYFLLLYRKGFSIFVSPNFTEEVQPSVGVLRKLLKGVANQQDEEMLHNHVNVHSMVPSAFAASSFQLRQETKGIYVLMFFI